MVDEISLLKLTKSLVVEAANCVIFKHENIPLKRYKFEKDLVREIKSNADFVLEKIIISGLEETEIPILCEETGYHNQNSDSDYCFIVDPLDGTFNFVKDFGSCAISIALWKKDNPVFGVIYDLTRKELYWGGKNIGAFCEAKNIKVSPVSDIKKSLICSGFPVRYNFEEIFVDDYIKFLTSFAKVRMIGSAAVSILSVARGAAEAYFEKNIMIWDVAAGLAISEGAGGRNIIINTQIENSYDVMVSNYVLFDELKEIINE
tara:strand:- start:407 stop:1189 length:783 start_codon:yes stop_codon:yes gene_type:complete